MSKPDIKDRVKNPKTAYKVIGVDTFTDKVDSTGIPNESTNDVYINTNNSILGKIGVKREAVFANNFTRQTYHVENGLIEKINKLTAQRTALGEKGVKTKIINEALEMYFKDKMSL